MKLSKSTISILKNFSQIAPSIMIDTPGLLKTMSFPANNIIAIARIEEQLPSFGIFALDELCNILTSLDQETIDLDFQENFVNIKDNKVLIKYFYSDPQHIFNKVEHADKVLGYNDFSASFKLEKADLAILLKSSKIINFGTSNDDEKVLWIKMKDGNGTMQLHNENNNLLNTFSMDVKGQGDCDVKLRLSSLVFIPNDYDVFIGQRMIKFTSGTLNYFCATKK